MATRNKLGKDETIQKYFCCAGTRDIFEKWDGRLCFGKLEGDIFDPFRVGINGAKTSRG